MVRSLIKHEIKQTWQPLAILFGVTVIVSLITSAMIWTALPVISELGMLLGFLSSYSLPGVAIIALAVLYWNSSYRRRGYLTHTIPVRGSVIYWVKLGWGVLVTFLSMIVTLLLVQVNAAATNAYFEDEDFYDPIGSIRHTIDMWYSPPWWFWLGLTVTLFFWMAIGVIQAFFAVSIGSEKRFLSLGLAGPIVVWVILYVVAQILMVLAIALTPAVIHMDGSVWIEWVSPLALMMNSSSTDGFPLGVSLGTVVFGVAMVWRTKISWDKKVSLA